MVVSSTTMSSQEVAKFINHHYRVAVEVIQALGGEDPDCARFVGGMVRDMLLGTVAYDIDIAVSHTPEEATAIIERAGMKAIPTGLAHGTITVVHKGIPMQITSLRQDVDCDGRHAKVVFSKDWKADAKRRDFTFNALSASQHGQIYDYTGGLEDLLNGNVRFIGAPEERIAEDYLRILRYVRFLARFYHAGATIDQPSLQACVEHASGLRRLSVERIQQELWKIFNEPAIPEVLVIPEIWQILQTILPELTRRDHLLWLYRLQEHKQYKLPAFIYLAAGVEDGEMALEVSRRLRCSNNEQQALMQIISGAEVAEVDENILKGWLVDYGRENTRLTYLLVLSKNLALPHASYLQYIKDEPIPQFPLKGADLLHEGVEANAKMGALLQRAKTLWRNSGYTMQRAELISAALERGKK